MRGVDREYMTTGFFECEVLVDAAFLHLTRLETGDMPASAPVESRVTQPHFGQLEAALQLLGAKDPDDLSPKQALDLIYKLSKLASGNE